MKIILLMTLLGILTSCQTPIPGQGQDFFQGEQCSPEFKVVLDENKVEWVSVKDSVCRCRTYHIGKDYIGPFKNENGNVTVIRKPLTYCNLLKGYKPQVDTQLFSYLEWVRTEINLGSPDEQAVQDLDQ